MANFLAEAFSSVLEEIINEELSISNDVKNASDKVFENIKRKIEACDDWKESVRWISKDGNIRKYHIKEQAFFDEVQFDMFMMKVNVHLTLVDTKNDLSELWNDLPIGGVIDDFMEINIHSIGVGDKADYSLLSSLIQHEIEHFLQKTKVNGNLSSSMYDKANEVIRNSSNYNDDYVTIARLIYFYHPIEINANVNGFYNEVKKTSEDRMMPYEKLLELIESSIFYSEEREYNKLFNRFLEKLTTKSLREEARFFGINIGKLTIWLYRNRKYLESKKGKVIQKLINEIVYGENNDGVSNTRLSKFWKR